MNSSKIKLLLPFVIVLFFILPTQAQNEWANYPDTLNKKKLWTTVGVEMGIYLGGLSFLSFIWYKDKVRVPFHFYDDSKGYLQIDKAGHAYGAYRESYSAYFALRRAGVSKRKALIYGGPIGLIFQTPIEVFDGLYEGWGFSWPDMAANTFGSILFTAQEAIFDEQIILMKFSYSPSIYPDYHHILGENHLERFFLDYNGHTYWLSANLRSITKNDKIPPWLNVALGYSANGMIKEFSNPEFYRGEPFPKLERYRQYIFSLDIDLSRIKTRKKFLRKIFKTINLIKIPFPGIEWNRVDGFRGRAFYF